ncbi:sensor histidine kinase [Actinomadura geliboluensis]|uniref:sensor histidine kinase n=1 Tax=Actinomadura geliboluensis TaxID=882440 RepID=UPI0037242B70
MRDSRLPLFAGIVLFWTYRILVLWADPGPGGPPGAAALLAGTGAALGLGVLQARALAWRGSLGNLAAQAVLAYAPLLVLGGAWRPAAPLLMASVLLLAAPARARLPAAASIVAAEFVIRAMWLPDAGTGYAIWAAVVTLTGGLQFLALARLGHLVRALEATRTELAARRAAGERLRIARGLRAELGRRLSAAAASADPAEITAAARAALARARSVADDYRDRSLAAEIEAARTVLAASGVPVRVEADAAVPPAPRADAALAGVLRRTVVAALRDGRPDGCVIECRTGPGGPERLRVAFSGPVPPFAEPLAASSAEIAGLGGRLAAGPAVEAEIPRARAWTGGPVGAAPWLAFAVLLVLELDHLGTVATSVLMAREAGVAVDPARLAVAAVALPLVAALQLYHVLPRGEARPRRWALPAQIVLILAAFAVAGPLVPAAYGGLPATYGGLVAGVVLLNVRPPWSWAAATALLLMPFPLLYGARPPAVVLLSVLASAAFMISVHALGRLPVTAARLDRARRELVRTSVLRERLRIARDVHDLLGSQLSAIIIRGAIAAGPADGARLAELAGAALATVRSIGAEPAPLRLAAEVESARDLLGAAGARVRVTVAEPPAAVAALFAVVLRESVTNVVRHARARRCEISITPVRLRVSNDGAPRAGARRTRRGEAGGAGLANLRSRAAEAGGALAVEHADGRFTLTVEVPDAGPSDPARLGRDADGVDPVAGAQLGHR